MAGLPLSWYGDVVVVPHRLPPAVHGFFFFSSRRRHTRSDRDWSSDVCSSDLQKVVVGRIETTGALGVREAIADGEDLALPVVEEVEAHAVDESEGARGELLEARSEERRVGKEGRSRWSPYH